MFRFGILGFYFIFVILPVQASGWDKDTARDTVLQCAEHVLLAVAGDDPKLPALGDQKRYCTWGANAVPGYGLDWAREQLAPFPAAFLEQTERLDQDQLTNLLPQIFRVMKSLERPIEQFPTLNASSLFVQDIFYRSSADNAISGLIEIAHGFSVPLDLPDLDICGSRKMLCIAMLNIIRMDNYVRLREIDQDPGFDVVFAQHPGLIPAITRMIVHADGTDIAFRKRFLSAAKNLAVKGNLSPHLFANLADRVENDSNDHQYYGTQYTCRDGAAVIAAPITDAPNVDKRRSSIGLPPLDQYLQANSERCQSSQ